MHTLCTRAAARAFTLIELLVVVAIITLLIAVLVPALGRSKDLAKRAACGSNCRMLQTAATEYATEWNAFVGYSAGSDRKVLLYPYVNAGRNNADVSGSQVWFCPANVNPITQCGYGFNTNLNWKPISAVQTPIETVALCDSGLIDNGVKLADSLTTQVNAPSKIGSLATCLRPNVRHSSSTLNVVFFDGHVEALPLGMPFYPLPNGPNGTWTGNTITDPGNPAYTDGWWDLY